MSAEIKIIVIDEHGWQKPVQLEEGVHLVGSHPQVALILPPEATRLATRRERRSRTMGLP